MQFQWAVIEATLHVMLLRITFFFFFFLQSLKYLFSFSCPFVTIQTCNEAASNRLTKTISLKILACIFVCFFNTSIWGIVHWGSRQRYLSVLTEHQYSHIEAVTVIAAISNMKHSGILLKKCRRWYAKITHVRLTMEKKRGFFLWSTYRCRTASIYYWHQMKTFDAEIMMHSKTAVTQIATWGWVP